MKTILFAEDETPIRELLELLAQGWGYASLLAENAEAAIAFLGEKEVDLLVTDERMLPGADGWEVIRISRQLQPSRPVIMLSGTANASRCQNEKVVLLGKPFMPNALRLLIDQFLKPVTLADVYALQQDVETSFRVQDSDKALWTFFGLYFRTIRSLNEVLCEELKVHPPDLTKKPLETEIGAQATQIYRAARALVKEAKEQIKL